MSKFQSSRSLRTATHNVVLDYSPHEFQSSRSLRTATTSNPNPVLTTLHFNPRGPCGPRLSVSCQSIRGATFQSSRSLRTATRMLTLGGVARKISILAVLADRDFSCQAVPSP